MTLPILDALEEDARALQDARRERSVLIERRRHLQAIIDETTGLICLLMATARFPERAQ